MKRITILLASALMLSMASQAKAQTPVNEYPASDSKIVWVGRAIAQGDQVSGDWTGIYARIKFAGDGLAIKVSDTKKNYYNLWLDKETWNEPDKIVTVTGTDTTIVLLAKEEILTLCGKKNARKDSVHQITLQKRTEGEQGKTTFQKVLVNGSLLEADAVRPRAIEFVGDSYTCGYGSENSVKTDPFKPETENCNKSYCNIVARYFDAECILVAHSGFGIARNYNDNVKGWYMPERYSQAYDMDRDSRYDASTASVKPDITVIYLCTNDFSTGRQPSKGMFQENYKILLGKIKEAYGEAHPILCVAGKNDFLMAEYISEVANECGLRKVSFAVLCPYVHNSDDDLGASFHPNYEGHKKKAMVLIPYVATMTGWGLNPEKPIR